MKRHIKLHVFNVALLLPVVAFAHGENNTGIVHYLSSPEHLAPLLLIVIALVLIILKTSLNNKPH